MPSEADALGPSGSRRLPAVALLFLVLGNARQLLLPLIAFLAWPQGLVIWVFALLLPALLASLARYATFRYQLGDDEIVVRHGLLTRTERNIPYDRIQNVDLVQNPLHRMLDVAEVRLETASGGKPEAVIRVLTRRQIDELEGHLEARRTTRAQRQPGEARPPLITQSLRELITLGLLSNRGMLVVAAAMGFLQQSGLFDDPTRFQWLAGWLPARFEFLRPSAWSTGRWIVTVILFFVVFVIATRLLSVLWTVATLYGFRLERRGEDLAARYGLLTRVTATIPRRRIQLLSTHKPWLASPWRLSSTKVETAGGGASKDHQGPGAARLWLAPLLPEERLPELYEEAMPSVDRSKVDWRPLAAGAPRRLARRNASWALLLTLPVTFLVWPWGLCALALVPLLSWHGWRWAKRSKWGLVRASSRPAATTQDDASTMGESAVLFRSGALGHHESVVPLGKIQCVAMRETPFDRRWHMASLQVDTAGASAGGHRIDIPYLDRQTADDMAEHLSAHAASTNFLW